MPHPRAEMPPPVGSPENFVPRSLVHPLAIAFALHLRYQIPTVIAKGRVRSKSPQKTLIPSKCFVGGMAIA